MRAPVLALLLLLVPVSAFAQVGIGGRIAFVRSDVELKDQDAVRFFGGQIRARMSPRTGFELSLDRRSETNEAETLRVVSQPIQASLLVFLSRGQFAPFLLGGAGWYGQKFETLAGDETLASETVRDFGWHAGFGAELRMGKHAGLHGDYRYTFLDFNGDDDDDDEGLIRRLLPAYKGSMWTAGFTVYF
jgi:outer membrane protein with beta-barrel domain